MTDVSLQNLNLGESSLIVLPEEVLELVVDHLSDKMSTLLLCRLVCSRWLDRSRRWLYLDAIITIPGCEDITPKDLESSQNLIELLQSPHLKLGPSNIRKLTIIGPHEELPCTCCDIPIGCDPRFYDSLNTVLEASLPFMGHVRDLCLRRFDFAALNGQAQAQIAGLSQVTSLECYQMEFDYLEDMLAPFQNIKELKADGVVTTRGDTRSTSPGSPHHTFLPLTSVDTLFVTVTASSSPLLSAKLLWPKSIVSLTMFTNDSGCLNEMAEFITAAGSSLEHFALHNAAYYDDFPIKLDLNNRLKTLTLKVHSNSSIDLEWFEHIVSTTYHETEITVVTWLTQCDGKDIGHWDTQELEEFFSRFADRNIFFTLLVPKEIGDLINSPNSRINTFLEQRFPDQLKRGLFQAKVDATLQLSSPSESESESDRQLE